MKINRITSCLATLALVALMASGCAGNIPPYEPVLVEDVQLPDELKNGLTLEINDTYDISLKVEVIPEESTEKAENYSSSDPEVVSVDGYGLLTALKPGTSTITVTVGGKSVSFTTTVITAPARPFETIVILPADREIKLGESFDISTTVSTTPSGTNDKLEYRSSNSNIVRVSDSGVIEGVALGRAVITVSSMHVPTLKAELTVDVFKVVEYDRTGWTMTASHSLPTDAAAQNSITAALDGDEATNFSLVRPTKTYGGVTVPSGDAIWFTVDMKTKQPVSFFQIDHRDRTQPFIRWFGFDQILGSDDGTNFDVIATNVRVTNAEVSDQRLSPEIYIPTAEYRYIRFYAKEASCFNGGAHNSQGSTVQIKELYIGAKLYQ